MITNRSISALTLICLFGWSATNASAQWVQWPVSEMKPDLPQSPCPARWNDKGASAVSLGVVERNALTHFLVNSGNEPVILRYDGETGQSYGVFATHPELQDSIGGVPDMTIGPDGHLYVSNHGLDLVSKYEAVCGTGVRLETFAGGEPGSGPGIQSGTYLDGAGGLGFGTDGHLYVVSSHHYSILKYDGASGGTVPLSICDLGPAINPLMLRFHPTDGVLYFSAAGAADAIFRFTDFDSCSYETFIATGTGGLNFRDQGGFT